MSIGTEHESALHRELKQRYTARTEVAVRGFICDGLTDDNTVIEVQTGSFGPLKTKAAVLCETHKLIVIHPVILKKDIDTFDAEGNFISRKLSPRKGTEWDVFKALIYAPRLPLIKNLSIELALVDVIEKRLRDGKGSWRRKGVSIGGHSLSAYHGGVTLAKPEDYRRFLPFVPGEEWTTLSLAQKASIRRSIAQKTLYVLSHIGIIRQTGKHGRFRLWTIC